MPRSPLIGRGIRPLDIFQGMEAGFVPVVGAKLVAINDESLGHIFGVSSGVLVTEVFGDPAESSGLKGGDVIRRADGRDITDVAQLRRIVAAHGGDRNVDLEVVATAAEDRRLTNACDRVEVARRSAAAPGLALPGEPDPAAVVQQLAAQ